MFVFTILQIPSGVWRFVVGVLHSPGYGPGLHSISVLGVLTSWWISLLWHFWETCWSIYQNQMHAPWWRGSKSLCNVGIIFLSSAWEPNAHILNLKVTWGFHDKVSESAFQARHCTLEIMWQTGKQSFLFEASVFCCHRIMIWYSEAQRMYLSWGAVPLQIL